MCYLYSAPYLAIFIAGIFSKAPTTFPYNALATDQILMLKQATHFFLPSSYILLAMSDRNALRVPKETGSESSAWKLLDTFPASALWLPLPCSDSNTTLVIVTRKEINIRGSSVQGEGLWITESYRNFPQCPAPCWLAQSLPSSGASRVVLLSWHPEAFQRKEWAGCLNFTVGRGSELELRDWHKP